MPEKFNELLLKPDIIELYNSGITPNYGYLMNGRFEKDMIKTLYPLNKLSGNPIAWEASGTEYLFPSVSFVPKQEGSGDPSPDNVRPISGYDSVTVNGRGKNLITLEHTMRGTYGYVLGVTRLTEYRVFLVNGATYTLSFDVGFTLPTYLYSVSKSSTSPHQLGNIAITGATSITFTVDLPTGFYSIHLYNGNTWIEQPFTKWQLEVGSTPTAYEPYQPGTTATLTLPETIYGGTVDVVAGEGEKTWGYLEFNGSESWGLYEPSSVRLANQFRINLSGFYADGCVSSHYKSNTTIPQTDKSIQSTSYFGNSVNICDSGFNAVEEWKAYLAAQYAAGTPVTIAYQLATPEPFQATGNQQLTSLTGYNTIYTNGDSITLSRKVRRLEV